MTRMKGQVKTIPVIQTRQQHSIVCLGSIHHIVALFRAFRSIV